MLPHTVRTTLLAALDNYQGPGRREARTWVQLQPMESLSAREMEVARLVMQGKSNREIARELTVALATVRSHLARILAKLGLHNRTQIAVWALRLEMVVDPGDDGEAPDASVKE